MENLELGAFCNAIIHNAEGMTFDVVQGKISGFFLDPHGRQFVQIKMANGTAKNVDRFAVNASTADREKYMEAIKEVKKIEQDGNKQIEELQKTIVENCNKDINDIFASLTPLIDLSFENDETEDENE